MNDRRGEREEGGMEGGRGGRETLWPTEAGVSERKEEGESERDRHRDKDTETERERETD